MEHPQPSPSGLTPEQLEEFAAMRAESSTHAARAEEEVERAAIMREFLPARPTREMLHMLARLRKERERRKLSLDEVASRARMTKIAISRLERGQGNPTLATVGRLLDAMGLRLNWTFAPKRAKARTSKGAPSHPLKSRKNPPSKIRKSVR